MLFFVTHFLTNFGFSWPFFGTFFMQFGITFDRKTLYSPENWLRNVSKHKNIKKKKKKNQGCSSYKKNCEQTSEVGSYLTSPHTE